MYLSSHYILRKRKGRNCLQLSSVRCHAWRSALVCCFPGKSVSAGSRCPSWSTGPSHPGRHFHNGRHRPSARKLSARKAADISIQTVLSNESCRFKVFFLPFLSPKSVVSTFTTPSETEVFIVNIQHERLQNRHSKTETHQVFPQRTRGPHSLSFPGRGSAVENKTTNRLFK